MNKSDLVSELKDLIVSCEEKFGHYEELHGKEIAKGESSDHTIWSEMRDWYNGKICAYTAALSMVKELEA